MAIKTSGNACPFSLCIIVISYGVGRIFIWYVPFSLMSQRLSGAAVIFIVIKRPSTEKLALEIPWAIVRSELPLTRCSSSPSSDIAYGRIIRQRQGQSAAAAGRFRRLPVEADPVGGVLDGVLRVNLVAAAFRHGDRLLHHQPERRSEMKPVMARAIISSTRV